MLNSGNFDLKNEKRPGQSKEFDDWRIVLVKAREKLAVSLDGRFFLCRIATDKLDTSLTKPSYLKLILCISWDHESVVQLIGLNQALLKNDHNRNQDTIKLSSNMIMLDRMLQDQSKYI